MVYCRAKEKLKSIPREWDHSQIFRNFPSLGSGQTSVPSKNSPWWAGGSHVSKPFPDWSKYGSRDVEGSPGAWAMSGGQCITWKTSKYTVCSTRRCTNVVQDGLNLEESQAAVTLSAILVYVSMVGIAWKEPCTSATARLVSKVPVASMPSLSVSLITHLNAK
ncbi:uncharacterized protein LOC132586940 isoform X2 [Heteronotia binoei]|uniref:uncharacterized protein LOC132586940 isoform X2 n=1 Tax=Heteronotia binoei TaxID=13085 RepID=UPI00292CE266|nr:uncharacterized protein LOC132586940 isoform X2 [Heteronotia binoei]